MKKIVKLTENDLTRLVKRVIKEQNSEKLNFADFYRMMADAVGESEGHIQEIINPDESIHLVYNKASNILAIYKFKDVNFLDNKQYIWMLADALYKKFGININHNTKVKYHYNVDSKMSHEFYDFLEKNCKDMSKESIIASFENALKHFKK